MMFINAIAIIFLWDWIVYGLLISRDTTDGPGFWRGRSGLRVYKDHATGVQYVGTLFGSVTPRLDKDGRPYTGE